MLLLMLLLFRSIWDREAAFTWFRQANPLVFFLVMAGLIVAGVPLTPLFVIAGATFGIRGGLLGSLLALAGGLALTYRIARGSLRPRLDRLLRRFDYVLPNFARGDRSALRFTLMVKFAPGVPGFIKNYGLAIAGVPFSVYFVVSMLITGAYAALLIVVGESLLAHDVSKTVWALLILLLMLPISYLWIRRRRAAAADGSQAT
jgi:uncharacterized membrane protein YdjX (TVP38/TMEM64 family)